MRTQDTSRRGSAIRPASNTTRWRAVLSHDARQDGAFVYGVRSTGIYCRPSCPSRRPRRAQVKFFALPQAAEQAGFRACRRCKPERSRAVNAQAALVERVCHAIKTRIAAGADGAIPLAALSGETGVSPHHLQRTFKRLMGITPRQYADAERLGVLKTQ